VSSSIDQTMQLRTAVLGAPAHAESKGSW